MAIFWRALVTSHLGFAAHNAFLGSEGEDSPFLPKKKMTKDSRGNHWDAAELSSNLSTPCTDMKTIPPSFQTTPSPLSHRVLWDASQRTTMLERIPFAQNNWIFITKRENVYDRHSVTWQQMHLPDGGETWPAIQLNIHLPGEWSPCSLTTRHSNSFLFPLCSPVGRIIRASSGTASTGRNDTFGHTVSPLQLGSKGARKWKMGSQFPAGIYGIWTWVVLPFPSPL